MMIVLISWLPVTHKWTAAFGLTSMRKRTMLVSFPAVGHCHHIEPADGRKSEGQCRVQEWIMSDCLQHVEEVGWWLLYLAMRGGVM